MKKLVLLALVLFSSVSCTIEEFINQTTNVNEQQTQTTTQIDGDVDPIKVKPPTGG